jgi:hypothetical protein
VVDVILLLQLLFYFSITRKTRRVEHPLLPEWVEAFLAFYDDSRFWDSTSWVEIKKIVACIRVDRPNPSIESDLSWN